MELCCLTRRIRRIVMPEGYMVTIQFTIQFLNSSSMLPMRSQRGEHLKTVSQAI